MRRLLASILLLCVGLSLPAAGGPLCLCVASWFHGESDCCGHDGMECSEDCPKIERLPDASVPESAPEAPAVPVIDLAGLPDPMMTPPPGRPLGSFHRADRIRGPTTGPPLRALLASWRL